MASSVELGKLEKVVDRLVETGRFKSRSEVLEEGVRLVEERENYLAEFKEAIDEGLADAEAGRVFSVEEVRSQLLKEFSLKS